MTRTDARAQAIASRITNSIFSRSWSGPDVTARATEGLRAAGYSDTVEVVTGDGWCAVDSPGSFDAIIVTAGSWDVAPAWRSQLAAGGTIVVPLRLHGGWTRSIAGRRAARAVSAAHRGDHLAGPPSRGVKHRASLRVPLPL